MTTFHFLNVGQGNMAVGIFPDNKVLVYDCNITNDNEAEVFAYLAKIMPKNTIDLFVNSHRDADHMTGIKKLHDKYPISSLFDSGVSGNTGGDAYEEYMEFRRGISRSHEVEANHYWTAHPNVNIINGKREGLDDTNSQSIVLHIDHNGSQLLLAGDSDVIAWRDYIIPEVGAAVQSLVLYASHHGSHSFFNEDTEANEDYTRHLAHIKPAITIISVGETNPHGHPKEEALAHYESHSYGADNGQKIFRTDQHGNIKVELHGGGTGTVYWRR